MIRYTLLLLSMLLTLSGCCSTKPPPSTSTEPGDSATIQLAEAAASISQSLTQLSAIQQANTPTPRICLPITCACEMQRCVSVDWAGPIAPLLRRIACMANFRLRIIGVPPAIPILVSINAKGTPLGDILRDVSFQAGTKAHVCVHEECRIIELRYLRCCDCNSCNSCNGGYG